MEKIHALCARLGYSNAEVTGTLSRASSLLHHLETFVHEFSLPTDANAITSQYFASPTAIFRNTHLYTPKGDKITDLMSQLFDLILQSRAPQHEIVDLEDEGDDSVKATDKVRVSSPEAASTNGQGFQDHALELETQTLSPMRRLSIREPSLISEMLKAGFAEPLPIVAQTQDDLRNVVAAWMAARAGKVPPGVLQFKAQRFGKTPKFTQEITFATTACIVSIKHLQIHQFMVRILEDVDGLCMMVRPHPGPFGYQRGYHGWRGGDHGFSPQLVAGSFKDLPSSRSCHADARRAVDASSNVVEIKKEPTRCEIRQASLRHKQNERQTDQRWRLDTPPLSSLETVKKRRWPPQYVSPSRTPQRDAVESSTPKRYKRRNISGHLATNDRNRSSSPVYLSTSPVTPSPDLRRSGRATRSKTSLLTPPRTPAKTKARSKKASKPVKARGLAQKDSQSMGTQPVAGVDVTLHFFLSNETLGAVPVTLAQCDSFEQFFDQAEAAWKFLGTDTNAFLAGVSVAIDGVEWPMVVVWKDLCGYDMMMRGIEAAKVGKTGVLSVKVKCIGK